MKKKVVCIAIENDGYLVKEDQGLRFTKIMPHNIYKIPNIPFYHSAWTYHNQLIVPEITELKEYITQEYGKINKLNGLIAIPADSLPVDKRMIEETFQLLGFPKCNFVSKTALLAYNRVPNYIALSASERLVILEWYHKGKAVETVFYNKSAVNRNKLFNDIGNIRYKENDKNLNLYIFDGCNELRELYELGQAFSASEIIEMLDNSIDTIFSAEHQKSMKKK